jgi:hypothetical protein
MPSEAEAKELLGMLQQLHTISGGDPKKLPELAVSPENERPHHMDIPRLPSHRCDRHYARNRVYIVPRVQEVTNDFSGAP